MLYFYTFSFILPYGVLAERMGAMETYGSGATKGRRRITYSNDNRNTNNGSKLRYEIFCHLLTVSFMT